VIDLVLSDPTCRAVAADYLQERGVFSPASWLERMGVTMGAVVARDAYADATDANAPANADADAYATYADADAYTEVEAHADAFANASVSD